MEQEKLMGWEDPPAYLERGGDQKNRYAQVVHDLRRSRGAWALLEPRETVQAAKSLAANIKTGRLASFAPAGAFEARYLGPKVWVRYVGEPGTPDSIAEPKKIKPDNKTASAVRAWAKSTGRKVSDRGPIAVDLVNEWRQATRGQLD